MNSIPNKPPGTDTADEELIDTLIAVSVVAKRLAEKLRKPPEKGNAFRCSRCGRENGRQSERRKPL